MSFFGLFGPAIRKEFEPNNKPFSEGDVFQNTMGKKYTLCKKSETDWALLEDKCDGTSYNDAKPEKCIDGTKCIYLDITGTTLQVAITKLINPTTPGAQKLTRIESPASAPAAAMTMMNNPLIKSGGYRRRSMKRRRSTKHKKAGKRKLQSRRR
jgi:hypothetical protein